MRRTGRTYLGVFFIAIATVVFLTAHDIQAFAGESDLQYKSRAEKQRIFGNNQHLRTKTSSQRFHTKKRKKKKVRPKKHGQNLLEFATASTSEPRGTISGRMRDKNGNGLSGYVDIYDANDNLITWVLVNYDGSYTVSNLRVSSYKVFFDSNDNYIDQWYNNKRFIKDAELVPVNGEENVANINATLDPGGSMSGSMKDEAENGISGYVDIYDAEDNLINWDYSVDGSYTVLGLREGSYKVFFDPDDDNYLDQWYDNKGSIETANTVSVEVDKDTPAIDAKVALGGSISGSMKDKDGNGIPGFVDIYDVNDTPITWVLVNSDDGSYTVSNLRVGSYKVFFDPDDDNYLDQWYDNKGSIETANTVYVEVGKDTPAIDAEIALGGSISGSMKDKDGNGLSGYVDIYDANDNIITWVLVNSDDGSYTVSNLRVGSYKVFFDLEGNYLDQWYDNKGSIETANTVYVEVGKDTPAIDAEIALGGSGGSISGSMKDEANGIPGFVDIYDADNEFIAWIYADNFDGSYTVSGLRAGEYKVFFDPDDDNYLDQWYDNKGSIETANTVSVAVGEDTPAIDAVFASGGSISGSMKNEAGNGIAGYVWIYNTNDEFIDWNYSTDGSYTVSGLPAGEYKVEFDPDGNYIGEWYNNADSVSVDAGDPTTSNDINAVLAPGGSISGRMNDAQGNGIFGFVDIYDENDKWINWVYVDSFDGSYIVSGLPEGSYKVFFDPDDDKYLDQWYDNKGSSENAEPVSVGINKNTFDINYLITKKGSIIPIIMLLLQ